MGETAWAERGELRGRGELPDAQRVNPFRVSDLRFSLEKLLFTHAQRVNPLLRGSSYGAGV